MHTYVESVSSNLTCCICRMPFTDPYTTETCQHTFCKDCITHSLTYHSNQCPIDRLPLSMSDLTPANPIIRSLVDELLVECPHKEEGCTFTTQRQSMAAHLLSDCPYRKGYTLPEADDSVPHSDDADVEEFKTEHTPGFTSQGTQTEPTHEPLDERFAALSEQNILLRHRTELLESTISVMKREMATVRRALGPWFRAAEGTATRSRDDLRLLPTSPAELSGSSISLSPQGRPTEYVGENATAGHVEATLWNPLASPSMTPGRSEEDPPVFLDVPFQQPYGFGTRPQPDILRQQRRYSTGARTEPRTVQSDATVAPLNLNTSLEGTMAGLRESLVGLATTVDSMGRRHEMSLAHEGMRVGEELGGLRAAIHGLRMQVHSIMMDRNAQVTGRPPMFNGLFMGNGPPDDTVGGPGRPINQVKL